MFRENPYSGTKFEELAALKLQGSEMTRKRQALGLFALLVFFSALTILWLGLMNAVRFPLYDFQSSSYHSISGYSLQFQLKKAVEKSQASIHFRALQIRNVTDTMKQRINGLQGQLQDTKSMLNTLEKRLNALENASDFMRIYMAQNVEFRPLIDLSIPAGLAPDGIHRFMSSIRGRGMAMGTPEFFNFPSDFSDGRILCIKGNSTSNGTVNQYAFAFPGALPSNAVFLGGYTLISENIYDFVNPWHSLTNFVPFFYWKTENQCSIASRFVFFHLGQLNLRLGDWIKRILEATGLSPEIESLSYDGRPVCFEKAVVNRMGLHRVQEEDMFKVFQEIRCKTRRMCNVSKPVAISERKQFTVSLVVRSGGRAFRNESAWRDVVKSQCESLQDCKWVVMYPANLTFCQQVETMSKTDILVSAHGAQLANMIFMSPGGRVLEMFPKGWLELAGPGQYVFRNLCTMVGLKHEGFWRDPSTPDCPNPRIQGQCMSFYKGQNIGLNATYVASWIGKVIQDFRSHMHDVQQNTTLVSKHRKDSDSCRC